MNAQPELRPAGPADDEFLFEVFVASRDDEMALLDWSDQQKREFLMMQHRAQASDYRDRFPGACLAVVEIGGEPVGRLWVERNAAEIRILDITIQGEHRGQGIGTALLRGLQHEAQRAGVPLRDSVYVGNARAEALYRRLGFVETADTGTYRAMEWRA